MTNKELCETWVRMKSPGLSQQEVERQAEAVFNMNPDGSLWHLAAMRYEMIAHGALPDDPIPENPNMGDQYTVRTETGAARRTWGSYGKGMAWSPPQEVWRNE